MSSIRNNIVVIMNRFDIYSFLGARLIQASAVKANRKCMYHIVDKIDRRTWPKVHSVRGQSVFVLGDLPSIPTVDDHAHQKAYIKQNEEYSVAKAVWKYFLGPFPQFDVFKSVENIWRGEATSEEEWGLRAVLFKFTEMAEKEGMEGALAAYDAQFNKSIDEVRSDLVSAYRKKIEELESELIDIDIAFLNIDEIALEKCKLPEEWLGLNVCVADTSGINVDTGLLAHYMFDCCSGLDVLVQYRRIQLTGNTLHKYYCRGNRDCKIDLRTWPVLKGHAKAASGECHGSEAPFADKMWLECMDEFEVDIAYVV